ncbi:MAG: hypothetical protein ACI80I_001268 [Akkermansiaceae bacterium]|jgi:hypothetical protein
MDLPTMSDTDDDLHKYVTFIQHHLPGLTAGKYELNLEISAKGAGNDPAAPQGELLKEDTLNSKYTFAVKGERFAIIERDDVIHSVFPFSEDDEAGDYASVLPHVVFKKKTFPWIRSPKRDRLPPKLEPGKDTDEDVPTWLGLLLFDADETGVIGPVGGTIQDLLTPDSNTVSYNTANEAQDDFLGYGENPSDAIQYIDISWGAFNRVAPSFNDLKFLAHSRRVSLDPKPSNSGLSNDANSIEDFSIVFGNRLPKEAVENSDNKSLVYLVSLEGMEDYLPQVDDDGNMTYSSDTFEYIRLAVLSSWSFKSSNETTAGFVDRMKALSTESSNSFRLPEEILSDTGDEQISAALRMGYVPLNHNLRTGEQTVSWYRGPFRPYRSEGAGKLEFPITSPDKVSIFDPTTGMLDVSYASAWTLGRMLALQDKAFSTGLYQWKKSMEETVVRSVEDEMLQSEFSSILVDDTAGPALMTTSSSKSLNRARGTKRKLYTSFMKRLAAASKG